jgi:hypothetical protein
MEFPAAGNERHFNAYPPETVTVGMCAHSKMLKFAPICIDIDSSAPARVSVYVSGL